MWGEKLSRLLALNTNNIVDELRKKLTESSSLSELETRRYIKQANNQSLYECKYSILALVYTINGDKESAKENALMALNCIKQNATLANSIAVLRMNSYNSLVIDVINRFIALTFDASVANILIPYLVALPNIEQFRVMSENITKSKSKESAIKALIMSDTFISNAIKSEDEFNIEQSVIGKISRFAAIIADRYNGIISHTFYDISPSREWMSLIFHVEKGDFDLVDLNLALADELIENDLALLPLVARFDLPFAGIKEVRLQYGS